MAVFSAVLILVVACTGPEDSTVTIAPSPTSGVVVATATAVVVPTDTPVVERPTAIVDVATATVLPVPTPTAVPTAMATATALVTGGAIATPTSISTVAPVATATPTALATVTPTSVSTPIVVPTVAADSDLHGDDSSTATSIQQGYPMAGRIEPAGDVDWFSFFATRGSTYSISVDPDVSDPEADPLVRLVDNDGKRVLIVDDNRGGGVGASIEWVAPASQAYYLNVGTGATSVAGAYTVLVNEGSSDHSAGMANATDISVGGTVVGRIEAIGDRDWFAFEAVAGTGYEVVLSAGSLADSSVRLLDQDGLRRLAAGSGSLDWIATDSGVYFLSVGGGGGTGAYDISLAGQADDYGNVAGAAQVVNPGAGKSGVLETVGDQDWFVFSSVKGTEYRFFLPSAPDGVRLDLFDFDGTTRLVGNTDTRGGAPTIVWAAPESSHYYVAISASAGTGSYVLATVAVSDDHPDSSLGATSVTAGSSTSGKLETLGDEDWFAISASEGVLYEFALNLGSLSDSTLTLLDTDGAIRIMTDDGGGDGESSLLTWMAPASKTYFLKVRSPGGRFTGTYNLVVSAIVDDVSDLSTAAVDLLPDGTMVAGLIETAGDIDWYSFEVLANTDYTITLTSNGLRTVRMDLFAGSVVDGLFQANTGFASGATLYTDTDAVSGTQTVSFKDWSAYAPGTYFVSVESYLIDKTGAYLISISTVGKDSRPMTGIFDTVASASDYGGTITDSAPDEHGDLAGATTMVAVGSTVVGRLTAGDVDWFGFTAVGGQVYRFETASVTLNDPDLKLYDIGGVLDLDVDLDSGEGKAARLEWTAPVSGTYWVAVYSRLYSGNKRSGSYWLTITTETDPQGEVSTDSEALELGVSGADHVTVAGDLETRGDSDWYAFTAETGGVYRIEANGVSLADPDLNLFDVDGSSLLVLDSDSGEGKAGRIEWVAPANGTYWVEVHSRNYSGNDGVGGYVLTLSGEPDDHVGAAAEATLVEVGSAVGGDLETRGDLDWFAFSAVEGSIYRLSAAAVSLADLDMDLFDLDGTTSLGFDIDSGVGKSAWMEWGAPATGTYRVEVSTRNYSGNPRTGTYRLSIESEPDDHGTDWRGATALGLGDQVAGYMTVAGDFERKGDVDWFAFTAVEGWTYRLKVDGVTLGDPDLNLYDGDGVSLLEWDLDSGEGMNAFIEWVAPAGGLYFAKVSTRNYSGNAGVGAYTMTVSGA